MAQPVYFLATGGIAHMLRHLANCLLFPQLGQRPVAYVSTAYPTTGVPLDELFTWSDLPIVTSAEAVQLAKDFVPPIAGWPARLDDYQVEWEAPDNYVLLGAAEDTCRMVQLRHWLEVDSNTCIVTTGSWGTDPGKYRGNTLNEALAHLLPRLTVCLDARERMIDLTGRLPERYIGVHFRNTDMRSDFTAVAERMRMTLSTSGAKSIYWATDDPSSLARAQEEFPDFEFMSEATLPNEIGVEFRALHFAPNEVLRTYGLDKRVQQLEALVDIFALSRATNFIGNGSSGMSAFVDFLRDAPATSTKFFTVE